MSEAIPINGEGGGGPASAADSASPSYSSFSESPAASSTSPTAVAWRSPGARSLLFLLPFAVPPPSQSQQQQQSSLWFVCEELGEREMAPVDGSGGWWALRLPVRVAAGLHALHYVYELRSVVVAGDPSGDVIRREREAAGARWPGRELRLTALPADGTPVEVRDRFVVGDHPEDAFLHTATFVQALFPSPADGGDGLALAAAATPPPPWALPRSPGRLDVTFRVRCTCVPRGAELRICGSVAELGGWNVDAAVSMHLVPISHDCSAWEATVDLCTNDSVDPESIVAEYKYIIAPKTSSKAAASSAPLPAAAAVQWETRPNRVIRSVSRGAWPRDGAIVIVDDFPAEMAPFRAAGLAVDLASVRTGRGMGIGEFADIPCIAEWASKAGFSLVQLMPVTETADPKSTVLPADPDAPVSVHALHPAFVRLDDMTNDPDLTLQIARFRAQFNARQTIDFPEIVRTKQTLLAAIFEKRKPLLAKDSAFQEFKQRTWDAWLGAYAEWKQQQRQARWDSSTALLPEDFDAFVQFEAHTQLLEASRIVRMRHIALHVDVPCSVHPEGVDIRVNPGLFRGNVSLGVPPGRASPNGRNRLLPAHNWEAHRARGYTWWTSRLSHLGQYFQGVCLRDVGTYFREWIVSSSATSGKIGRYHPHVPAARIELERRGIANVASLYEPCITDQVVVRVFGPQNVARALKELLVKVSDRDNSYTLRPEIADSPLPEWAAEGVQALRENKLLLRFDEGIVPLPSIEESSNGALDSLDRPVREVIRSVHDEYYFGARNARLWKQHGVENLIGIVDSTSLFVSAEDSVSALPLWAREGLMEAGVPLHRPIWMRDLSLTSSPHWAVVASSSVSRSLLRCWWEEHRGTISARELYYNVLGLGGEMPHFCETSLVQKAVLRCLESPAIFALLPLQDLLALRPEFIAGQDPHNEQISRVGAFHYRMTVAFEDLLRNVQFINFVRALLLQSGRQ